ncbi:hypothetical protein EES44_07890 [Streptomyces sp. ADI96-15]|nr:hypothetical protein EES44_07890 [Streptomyces sp. ADI96-15]
MTDTTANRGLTPSVAQTATQAGAATVAQTAAVGASVVESTTQAGPPGPVVPRVIGLDLSLTCTGVAGEGWTTTIRPRAALRSHPRLALILDAVVDHVRGADLVVIEGPSFGGGVRHRHEDLAGLRVMVRHACWRRGIPYAVVPPSCRALYATGKGSGSKGAVRDEVRQRYGIECDGPGRYDQADAYVLLAMGLHHLGQPLAVVPDTHRRGLDGCTWPDTEGLAA